MKVLLALFLTMVALLPTSGTSYAERACGNDSWHVDAGKSPATFSAVATDGCHTYSWTNIQGQDSDSGTVTFKTSHTLQVWEKGSTLPQPNSGWCAYQAAHEANMHFVNYFQVADGTEVTVRYQCT